MDKSTVHDKKKKKSGLMRDIIALVLKLGWIAITIAAAFMLILGIYVQHGEGMSPAFHNKDIIIYYRLSEEISSGDTIVYADGSGTLHLGRVIAVQRDTVDITADGLTVNGYFREEPYAHGSTVLVEGAGVTFPLTLQEGEYFLLCDDRTDVNDSRLYGAVSAENIKGKALILIRHRDF
ncbi:MAG: signal peptidase I [Ruminococcus sp.]|nr:signal peptidase I [Ruminococcus sp.]